MNKYLITLVLVGVNILIFTWMALHQHSLMFNAPRDFLFILYRGANFNPFTVGGEYWRIFSSMFMHGGIIHLLVNMYVLFSLGRVLEPLMGSSRFFLLYMFAGIGASLSSLLFNLYLPSVGASGAIFGLYGYLVVRQILFSFRDNVSLGPILFNFILFVVVNYAIAQWVNVDTAGHIGGLVSGVVISVLHYFNVVVSVMQMALVTLLSPLLVFIVPKDQLHYYNTFQLVIEAEDKLQSVYGQLLTDDQRADSLHQVMPLLDSVQRRLSALNYVEPELRQDTTFLRAFVTLRQDEVNYRLLGYERESFVYLDSIEIIQARLDSLPPLKYRLNFRESGREVIEEEQPEQSQASLERVQVYYDSAWKEIPYSDEARYYRVGMRDSLGRWQGDVRDYFLDGKIQMKGRYLDDMHHGVFRYYTSRGKYEALGRYDKERPVGKWEEYHPNGVLEKEIYYGNQTFTKSVFDSLGRPQVTNGNGKQITWHANGAVAEEGMYEDGLKQGYWYGYHPSGKPHYQELYRNDLLVRGVAMTEGGERYIYDQVSVFPFPVMGMEAYRRYLEENVNRPEEARRIRGVVKLTFMVDRDGDIRDFVVMESLCIPCDQEAIRLVKEGPPWRPGVERGYIKIQSRGMVEVYF